MITKTKIFLITLVLFCSPQLYAVDVYFHLPISDEYEPNITINNEQVTGISYDNGNPVFNKDPNYTIWKGKYQGNKSADELKKLQKDIESYTIKVEVPAVKAKGKVMPRRFGYALYKSSTMFSNIETGNPLIIDLRINPANQFCVQLNCDSTRTDEYQFSSDCMHNESNGNDKNDAIYLSYSGQITESMIVKDSPKLAEASTQGLFIKYGKGVDNTKEPQFKLGDRFPVYRHNISCPSEAPYLSIGVRRDVRREVCDGFTAFYCYNSNITAEVTVDEDSNEKTGTVSVEIHDFPPQLKDPSTGYFYTIMETKKPGIYRLILGKGESKGNVFIISGNFDFEKYSLPEGKRPDTILLRIEEKQEMYQKDGSAKGYSSEEIDGFLKKSQMFMKLETSKSPLIPEVGQLEIVPRTDEGCQIEDLQRAAISSNSMNQFSIVYPIDCLVSTVTKGSDDTYVQINRNTKKSNENLKLKSCDKIGKNEIDEGEKSYKNINSIVRKDKNGEDSQYRGINLEQNIVEKKAGEACWSKITVNVGYSKVEKNNEGSFKSATVMLYDVTGQEELARKLRLDRNQPVAFSEVGQNLLVNTPKGECFWRIFIFDASNPLLVLWLIFIGTGFLVGLSIYIFYKKRLRECTIIASGSESQNIKREVEANEEKLENIKGVEKQYDAIAERTRNVANVLKKLKENKTEAMLNEVSDKQDIMNKYLKSLTAYVNSGVEDQKEVYEKLQKEIIPLKKEYYRELERVNLFSSRASLEDVQKHLELVIDGSLKHLEKVHYLFKIGVKDKFDKYVNEIFTSIHDLNKHWDMQSSIKDVEEGNDDESVKISNEDLSFINNLKALFSNRPLWVYLLTLLSTGIAYVLTAGYALSSWLAIFYGGTLTVLLTVVLITNRLAKFSALKDRNALVKNRNKQAVELSDHRKNVIKYRKNIETKFDDNVKHMQDEMEKLTNKKLENKVLEVRREVKDIFTGLNEDIQKQAEIVTWANEDHEETHDILLDGSAIISNSKPGGSGIWFELRDPQAEDWSIIITHLEGKIIQVDVPSQISSFIDVGDSYSKEKGEIIDTPSHLEVDINFESTFRMDDSLYAKVLVITRIPEGINIPYSNELRKLYITMQTNVTEEVTK